MNKSQHTRIFEILNNMDITNYDLSCAASALFAVHEAMKCGVCDVEMYSDAVFSVSESVDRKNKELAGYIDALFKEIGVHV